MLRTAVNPALLKEGLPAISIRLGADHGPAIMEELNVPTTGFCERAVKSDALNRSVKIQSEAATDQFLIGRELYERIHVQWLERCEEQDIDIAEKIGFEKYEIYAVS